LRSFALSKLSPSERLQFRVERITYPLRSKDRFQHFSYSPIASPVDSWRSLYAVTTASCVLEPLLLACPAEIQQKSISYYSSSSSTLIPNILHRSFAMKPRNPKGPSIPPSSLPVGRSAPKHQPRSIPRTASPSATHQAFSNSFKTSATSTPA
jgi:hypothetical protein